MSLLAVRLTHRSPIGELPGPAQAPEPDPGCRLAVVRQFALWPFGSRLLRLHLLVETGEPDEHLNGVLLRAMQQEYFRSEARSQTKAMRSVILSAHYVLQHRNHDALAHDRVTAAAAVLGHAWQHGVRRAGRRRGCRRLGRRASAVRPRVRAAGASAGRRGPARDPVVEHPARSRAAGWRCCAARTGATTR